VDGISERFSAPAAPGVTLHALRWGDRTAPTLVLLHGGGANGHWWAHLAPTLARSHAVVALDFRGHGASDHPEQLEVGAFDRDLEALAAHLGGRPMVLVGHSMGAHVALQHASRFDDVRGLVLLDPARGGARRPRRAARLALAFRRTYATRDEAIARYRFVPDAPRADEALRRYIAERSVREEDDGRFGFAFDPRWFTIPSRPAPDPRAVRCPALVVRGAESEILSAEGAAALAAELPDATGVEISEAGHHVLLDAPNALLAALEGWLASLPHGGAAADTPERAGA